MTTLTEIATGIAAVTLIVTNLTALWKSISNSGALDLIKQRLDDHSRRITEQGKEVTQVAMNQEPKK